MQKVAVSLEDRHLYELKAQSRLGNADSRSAAVRHIIDEYARLRHEYEDLHTEYERLEDRLETREERIDELEEQLARRSQLEEKIESLPEKVRETESYQDRRRRALDNAGALTRLKWRVTGVPSDAVEPEDAEGRPRK
jgi:hypothetical protein